MWTPVWSVQEAVWTCWESSADAGQLMKLHNWTTELFLKVRHEQRLKWNLVMSWWVAVRGAQTESVSCLTFTVFSCRTESVCVGQINAERRGLWRRDDSSDPHCWLQHHAEFPPAAPLGHMKDNLHMAAELKPRLRWTVVLSACW